MTTPQDSSSNSPDAYKIPGADSFPSEKMSDEELRPAFDELTRPLSENAARLAVSTVGFQAETPRATNETDSVRYEALPQEIKEFMRLTSSIEIMHERTLNKAVENEKSSYVQRAIATLGMSRKPTGERARRVKLYNDMINEEAELSREFINAQDWLDADRNGMVWRFYVREGDMYLTIALPQLPDHPFEINHFYQDKQDPRVIYKWRSWQGVVERQSQQSIVSESELTPILFLGNKFENLIAQKIHLPYQSMGRHRG
jgi:hypothetical protein